MAETYGRPPGSVQHPIMHPRLSLPGWLKRTTCSGGSSDISGAGAGDTVTAVAIGGVNQLQSATITYATSVANFARLICNDVNTNPNATYWGTWNGVDKILWWPRAVQTAADTSTVDVTESGFTCTDVNMNTAQAYVAAAHTPSWNYGIDMFPDTNMYQFSFDFSGLGSLDTNWTLASLQAFSLVLLPEDQVVNAYIGPMGYNRCPSAVETHLDVLGVMQGHQTLFMQAAAATNCSYRARVY